MGREEYERIDHLTEELHACRKSLADEQAKSKRLTDLANRMAEACAVAHQHLDVYGTVTGGHEAEMASQERAFVALGQFTRFVGHRVVATQIKV